MAQLSLRERLQPALLDRLIDDERLLTCYEFCFQRAELGKLAIPERDLGGILSAHGLKVAEREDSAAAPTDPNVLAGDVWRLHPDAVTA